MLNGLEDVPLGDGRVICLHSGSLTRSVLAMSDGTPFYRSDCGRCGARSFNLYWPAVLEPQAYLPGNEKRT